MIPLDIQIKSIIFSFLYGMFFSFLLNLNYKYIYYSKGVFKILVNVFFVVDNVFLYFIILRYINNGIEILKFVLDGTGVDRNILEAMASCDLNVSKASNVLYMHRNTLMYKIDRLYEKTGFDIKTFNKSR